MQVAHQSAIAPRTPLTAFPPRRYIKAANTDVQATWRAHGWQPPDPRYQAMLRKMLNRIS